MLTIGLIVACVLVFAYQSTKPDDNTLGSRQGFICEYGLVPDHVLGGGGPPADACEALNEQHDRLQGLVTSLFLHADLLHLGFNMLFLWVFGNNVEDRLGRIRFLPFFFLCGILAGLAQALTDPGSLVPLIGASGAISGILGAYLVLYPRVRVWTVVLLCSAVSGCHLGLARDLASSQLSTWATRRHRGAEGRLHGPHPAASRPAPSDHGPSRGATSRRRPRRPWDGRSEVLRPPTRPRAAPAAAAVGEGHFARPVRPRCSRGSSPSWTSRS